MFKVSFLQLSNVRSKYYKIQSLLSVPVVDKAHFVNVFIKNGELRQILLLHE